MPHDLAIAEVDLASARPDVSQCQFGIAPELVFIMGLMLSRSASALSDHDTPIRSPSPSFLMPEFQLTG